MGILSPIIEFIVEKEHSFPAPSEKEKLERAIKRYQLVLTRYPQRMDIGEIKFGLADMHVGRGMPEDYEKAQRLYGDILNSGPPDYLKARALIGKAEIILPLGKVKEIGASIEALDKARKILENDLTDFFACKAIVVEADLLLVRAQKGDRERAYKLCTELIKNKSAHWYFKARASLDKAEIILYTHPKELKEGVRLCGDSLKLLIERPNDYFTLKTKVIMAELRTGLGGKQDIFLADKYLNEVIKAKTNYSDLVARAKIALASITKSPQKAQKLAASVMETEALDPYLLDMAKQVAAKLKEPQPKKK